MAFGFRCIQENVICSWSHTVLLRNIQSLYSLACCSVNIALLQVKTWSIHLQCTPSTYPPPPPPPPPHPFLADMTFVGQANSSETEDDPGWLHSSTGAERGLAGGLGAGWS